MSLRSPKHHRVAEDFFAGACKTAEEIYRRGYDRLGFVFSDEDDSPLVGDQWLGACLRAQLRHSPRLLIPPFLFEKRADHLSAFAAWMKKHRPDVLMVTHAKPVLEWLGAIGLRVPNDIGLAALINDHPDRDCSGIHCSAQKLGALATETVLGLMQHGEIGIPSDPHEVLLCGEWIEGHTLRPA